MEQTKKFFTTNLDRVMVLERRSETLGHKKILFSKMYWWASCWRSRCSILTISSMPPLRSAGWLFPLPVAQLSKAVQPSNRIPPLSGRIRLGTLSGFHLSQPAIRPLIAKGSSQPNTTYSQCREDKVQITLMKNF